MNRFLELKITRQDVFPCTYIIRFKDTKKFFVGFSSSIYEHKYCFLNQLKNNINYRPRVLEEFNLTKDIENFEFLIVRSDSIEEAVAIKQEILEKYADTGLLLNTKKSAKNAKLIYKERTYRSHPSRTMQDRSNSRSHKVKVDEQIFLSITAAAKQYKLTKGAVRNRLSSEGFPNWNKVETK